MDKSGVIFGSVVGAIGAFVIFAFILFPPISIQPDIPSKDLIVPNGHDVSIVGETTPIYEEEEELPLIEITEQSESKVEEKELTLIEIFELSESGVVRINAQVTEQVRGTSVGSGFVFDTNGHIITNAHVIDNAKKIIVTFLDGRSYNAVVIGEDRFTDLAVIKSDVDKTLLYPLSIGDSSYLKVGEQIAAIGNPFGLSGSMTSGIVSQLGRLLPAFNSDFSIPDVIQTDAAINPGNSGGPLLNMKGEVIGINTAIQSATGEFSGVGFAIPSQTIKKIVPILIQEGEYHHPWLGISGRDIDPDLAKIVGLSDARGFLIVTVVENSPASKAGLQGSSETKEIDGIIYPMGGDIILSVDGIIVRQIDDILIHLQREKSVGDEIVLEIYRDEKTTNLVLILEERPEI